MVALPIRAPCGRVELRGDPTDVFNEYVRLLGASHGTIEIGGIVYNWVFGGVDMSKAPSAPMNAGEFTAKYPRLPQVVKQSIDQPTKDPDGKTTWAGGTTAFDTEMTAPPPSLPVTGSSRLPWLAGLVLCAAGLLLLALFRRRRRLFVS